MERCNETYLWVSWWDLRWLFCQRIRVIVGVFVVSFRRIVFVRISNQGWSRPRWRSGTVDHGEVLGRGGPVAHGTSPAHTVAAITDQSATMSGWFPRRHWSQRPALGFEGGASGLAHLEGRIVGFVHAVATAGGAFVKPLLLGLIWKQNTYQSPNHIRQIKDRLQGDDDEFLSSTTH